MAGKPPSVDIDEQIRVRLATAVVGAIGAIFGAALVFLPRLRGEPPLLPVPLPVAALIGFGFGAGVTYAIVRWGIGGAARGIGTIHNPSGTSTPRAREYSYPQSLVARGRYQEAVDAFDVWRADDPADPEPYVRIARIHRDHLGQCEEAISWFKRARREATMHQGLELVVTQEIVDIYTGVLNQPTRAIPELARLIDRFPNDPAVAWAGARLAELREKVRQNHSMGEQ